MKKFTANEKELLSAQNRNEIDSIYDSENDITLRQFEGVDGYFYTDSSGCIFWVSDSMAYDPEYQSNAKFCGQSWAVALK